MRAVVTVLPMEGKYDRSRQLEGFFAQAGSRISAAREHQKVAATLLPSRTAKLRSSS